MKKLLLFISILLFTTNVVAQGWPTSSATRPSFEGFASSINEDENDNITTETSSFAGDYITSAETDNKFGDQENPGNPNEVPIIESILGLLGLGGAYAWRLFSKGRRKED